MKRKKKLLRKKAPYQSKKGLINKMEHLTSKMCEIIADSNLSFGAAGLIKDVEDLMIANYIGDVLQCNILSEIGIETLVCARPQLTKHALNHERLK